jgi:mannose-6-phosphate isomerase-like protein (cupin superfamily)
VTEFRIRKLAELIEGWRQTTVVRDLTNRLADELSGGKEAFREAPLPEALVRDRLPPGIAAASLLVLRPKSKTGLHKHPNSVQHSAVLFGTGTVTLGRKTDVAQPFDPALPQRSIYVIRENMPHAFEAYNEPMVVITFQTAGPQALRELRAGTARPEREGPPRRTPPREKERKSPASGRRDKPGPRGGRGRGDKPGPRTGRGRPR